MAYGPYGPGGPQGGWGPRPPGPPMGGGYGPPPPQWRPPRRKNGSALVWVLGGLGLFAVLGVGFILVVALIAGQDSGGDTPIAEGTTDSPSDSYTPYSPTYSPTYSSYSPTYSSPTDTYSTESPSSSPSPTETVNTSRSKNDVYKAGALPVTRCPTGAENLGSTSAVRKHLKHLFRCLDKAWGPTLDKAGMDNESPGAVLTAGSGRGACGTYPPAGSGVPYYCPTNNTIYASIKAVTREYGRTPGYNAMAIDSLFAHEYGHHVQNMTGIMSSYNDAASSAGETKQLGLSRRLELQATCFAGMFMRSVKGSYPISSSDQATLISFNSNVGDWGRGPRNHGTPKHNGMWYKQGFDRKKAYQCNTWTISGSYTS